jgi:hypothetical protein
MGATSFTDMAEGNTAAAAFGAAVEKAYWEHGHGGYTGTIAEKPGYVLFKIPINVLPKRQREEGEPSWQHEPSHRISAAIYWAEENCTDWTEDYKPIPVDPADAEPAEWYSERPEALKNWYQMREDCIALRKALGKAEWDRLCQTTLDKWGPAAAVHLGGKQYAFFVLASC